MEKVQIFLAIATILGALIFGYKRSLRRNRYFVPIDIGIWWLAFLSLYSIQPVIYWLATGEFQSVATNRLEVLRTSATEIAEILTISACYAISFALTYFHFTKYVRFEGGPGIAKIGNSVVLPTAIIFAFLWIFTHVLFSDINSGPGYESKFVNLSELPLGVRRFHKFTLASLVISGIILVIAMSQRRSFRAIAVILIPILVLISSPGGSRGTAFLIALVFLISWHALVRPIPKVIWGSLALFGILAFNLLGAIRSYGRLPDEMELIHWLIASGEFEHIFGNAVKLLHAVHDGSLQVPTTTRFGEFYAFLPSEFLGFEKDSLGNWFMDTFYPESKAKGGGLAFGAIAQAVIGGGAVEALIRGAMLGATLGLICKFLVNHRGHWWAFPMYICFLVRIFDSVRSTTFSFLSDMIQIQIPFIIFLCILSSIFRKRPRIYTEAIEGSNK